MSRWPSTGWLAGPTPGHPRDHYALVAKQVYCHGFARADAKAPPPSVPFWQAVGLALAPTYDLSQIPVVVVGGDGATWLDAALEWFPQAVRQRDGFHLARDAARGWGAAAGATLYSAVRTGNQDTTSDLLALPLPPATATGGAARAHACRPPSAVGGAGGARPRRLRRPTRHARWGRRLAAPSGPGSPGAGAPFWGRFFFQPSSPGRLRPGGDQQRALKAPWGDGANLLQLASLVVAGGL